MSLADDLKNLDPNNPGQWPLIVQLGVGVILLAGLLFAGWHFHVKDQRIDLAKFEKQEQELRDTFTTKQKKAANLEALREQMKEMEQSFGDMLRQLPNRTEVAGLIVDISQTGLAAGLEFELFQPQSERPSEFYAELPINLRVTGDYHQFGEFVSGIAELPRIVTTHNISIEAAGGGKKGGETGRLRMSAVAKTYRALEDEES